MDGDAVKSGPCLASALRALAALAALCLIAARAVGDEPPTSTWFGTNLDAFTGAATGLEMGWFRASYILWQRDGYDLPPLVTTNPGGTPFVDAGALDSPSTTVVAGGFTAGDHWRSGYAFEGGYWLNPVNGTALTADYFNGGRDSYGFTGGGGQQIFAQPFFNAQTGSEDALLNNFPGELIGTIRLQTWDDFHGAGAALETRVWATDDPWTRTEGGSVSLFGGYRYYHHDSVVIIDTAGEYQPGNGLGPQPGSFALSNNLFAARNEFHGAELGVKGRYQSDLWWIDGLAGAALGGNRRFAFIDGATALVEPNGDVSIDNGGVYVSAITNFGRFKNRVAQVIPRLHIGLGCKLTERLSARVGYNMIAWKGVVQGANGLPTGLSVDPRNLPPIIPGGGPEPAFPGLKGTTVVAHGLDLTLEASF